MSTRWWTWRKGDFYKPLYVLDKLLFLTDKNGVLSVNHDVIKFCGVASRIRDERQTCPRFFKRIIISADAIIVSIFSKRREKCSISRKKLVRWKVNAVPYWTV